MCELSGAEQEVGILSFLTMSKFCLLNICIIFMFVNHKFLAQINCTFTGKTNGVESKSVRM